MINPEILKIIIWPVVIFGVLGISVIVLRKQIGEAICNIKSVGTKSIKVEMNSQTSVHEKVDKDHIEVLVNKFAEYIKPLEESIDKNFADRGISNPQEIIKTLKGQAALWYLAYQYEIIYHIAFGTQISLLQHLNANPMGIAKSEVTPFYNNSISKGLRDFTQDRYVAYLLDSGLVEIKADKYVLTRGGKGFLFFLLESNKDLDKGL